MGAEMYPFAGLEFDRSRACIARAGQILPSSIYRFHLQLLYPNFPIQLLAINKQIFSHAKLGSNHQKLLEASDIQWTSSAENSRDGALRQILASHCENVYVQKEGAEYEQGVLVKLRTIHVLLCCTLSCTQAISLTSMGFQQGLQGCKSRIWSCVSHKSW